MEDETEVKKNKNLQAQNTIIKRLNAQEKLLNSIRADLNENTRASISTKSDIESYNGKSFEKSSILLKTLINDLKNFKRDVERCSQDEKSELNNISIKLNLLNSELEKNKRDSASLEARVKLCELDVGIGYKS